MNAISTGRPRSPESLTPSSAKSGAMRIAGIGAFFVSGEAPTGRSSWPFAGKQKRKRVAPRSNATLFP